MARPHARSGSLGLHGAGPPGAHGAPLTDPMARRGRRYHFHLPGVVYGLTTAFLAVGAINSQNNLLFWAFGLAIAGLLVSGVVSGAALMGVELERLPVEPVVAGAPLVVRYRLRNRNRFFPAFALHVRELPEPGDEPGDWRALLATPTAFVTHAGPRQTVETASVAPTLKRGRARLGRAIVWTVFPFGLTRKSVAFEQGRQVIVRPRPIPADSSRPLTDRDPGPGAARSVRRASHAGEFFALRELREGDSPRTVAWRASARAGRLLIRQLASARAPRVWIVLDLGADGPANEDAISRAAGAIEDARARGSAVGLVVPAAGLRTPAREGRGHADALLDALAALPPAVPTVPSTPHAFEPPAGDIVVTFGTQAPAGPAPGRAAGVAA